jgi:hypothetical protein
MATALKIFGRDLQHLADNQPVSPECLYCETLADSEMVEYGEGRLHQVCYDRFSEEMVLAFPNELVPIAAQSFDYLLMSEQSLEESCPF